MGIWVVATGDIVCDKCNAVIGRIEYDRADGEFLEERVRVTCNKCLEANTGGKLDD